MPWIFLLLAVAALAAAWLTSSIALMVACLLVALGLVLASAIAFYARRADARRRDMPAPRRDDPQ